MITILSATLLVIEGSLGVSPEAFQTTQVALFEFDASTHHLRDHTVRNRAQFRNEEKWYGALEASFWLASQKQYVTIDWEWLDDSDSSDVLGRTTYYIRTSFHPTALDVRSDGIVMVAGINPTTGKTVVERWELALPSGMGLTPPPPKPGGLQSIKLKNDSLLLRTKKTLFDDDLPGKGLPRALFCPCGAIDDRLYVQFFESGDLYQLSWSSSGALTWTLIVADETLPDLGYVYMNNFWKGVHLDYGYVYFMSGQGGDGRSVILIDEDLDGEIDQWLPQANLEQALPDLENSNRYQTIYGIPLQ